MGPYRDGDARYFRSDVHERTVDEFAVEFAQEQVFGILLAWDAETATHRPPVSNDFVAGIVRRHPKRFAFFASVDPWKPDAVKELERAVTELGQKVANSLRRFQDFFPTNDLHLKFGQKGRSPQTPAFSPREPSRLV